MKPTGTDNEINLQIKHGEERSQDITGLDTLHEGPRNVTQS